MTSAQSLSPAQHFEVSMQDVTYHYGRGQKAALDGASVTIEAGKITGLLGRNGAGKSTLLALLANLAYPTSGSVRVGGREPFEDAFVAANTQLLQARPWAIMEATVKENFTYLQEVRGRLWDQEKADYLASKFKLETTKRISRLSLGQKAAFSAVIGIACRAPLSLFDEVHLGMDAPTRDVLYQELLADYLTHPRTIIISSHLITELEHLLENVVILDKGKVVLSEEVEGLKERYWQNSGQQNQPSLHDIFISLTADEVSKGGVKDAD